MEAEELVGRLLRTSRELLRVRTSGRLSWGARVYSFWPPLVSYGDLPGEARRFT